MPDAPSVLQYATPPSRLVFPWRRIGRVTLLLIIYGAIGGLLGWTTCPPIRYEAKGMLMTAPVISSHSSEATAAELQDAIRRNMNATSSPEHLASVATNLKQVGIDVDPSTLAASLTFGNPKGTDLIAIRIRHRDRKTAESIARVVMAGFPLNPRRTDDIGTYILSDGSISHPISQSRVFTTGGFFAGLLVCLLVLIQQRRRQLKG
jgi:capsular polysaccharide biosynthesis protein